MYGTGISHEGEVLDLATEAGIVEKSGAWYAYKENKIGQGKENAKVYLTKNPEVLKEIEDQVRECYGIDKKEKGKSYQKRRKERRKIKLMKKISSFL